MTFAVRKSGKGRAEGRLLKVEEASPRETDSPCPHFGLCGGCTYLSFPYEEQLAIKEAQVRALLDRALAGKQQAYTFERIKGSPAVYEYRNKMEFSFGDERKDGPLSLGMHKRGSFYDVVTTEDCCLVDEDYRKILRATLDFFSKREISYYHRMRKEGYLRHLLVRKASKTGEILVALVTTTDPSAGDLPSDWAALLRSLDLTGRLAGILHITNNSVADSIKNEGMRVLYGQEYFFEELLGLKFQITPFSFFQTNSPGAEVLYTVARDYLGETAVSEDKVVFDLYSGTGTIAQLLAPVAGKVVGVEIVEEAVEASEADFEG